MPEGGPYEALAACYEAPASRDFYEACARRLAEAVPETLSGRALDIGCGTGLSTAVLSAERPGLDWEGLDASQAMLAIARAKPALARVGLRQAQAERLPYEDGVLACVASNVAFHWFAPAAAAELGRVAAPGARLVLTVPLKRTGAGLEGNRLLQRMLFGLRGQLIATERQGFSPEQLCERLAGWTIDQLEPFEIDEAFSSPTELAHTLEARGSLQAIFGAHAETAARGLAASTPGALSFRWRFLLLSAWRSP